MVKKSSTTIYDIAAELKLSPATVSRVLSNSNHPVKDDVREAVLQTAKKMNYIPNAQARSLKLKKTSVVGVAIPSISNPFYPSIVRGMEDAAAEEGYFLYLCSCDRNQSRTAHYIQNMLEQNVDAIISIYNDTVFDSLSDYVSNGGILVNLNVMNDDFAYEGVYNIQVDKLLEARMATEHLLSLGHKKIALLMSKVDCQLRRDKIAGVRQSLEAAGFGLPEDRLLIYGRDCAFNESCRDDTERGIQLVDAMLERCPDVTAIICMNDIMAMGAIYQLNKRGYQVPGDYSVMGYDDNFISPYSNPTISTVALDKYSWGQSLMRFALSRIKENRDKEAQPLPTGIIPEGELLKPITLIHRESTGVPRLSF